MMNSDFRGLRVEGALLCPEGSIGSREWSNVVTQSSHTGCLGSNPAFATS